MNGIVGTLSFHNFLNVVISTLQSIVKPSINRILGSDKDGSGMLPVLHISLDGRFCEQELEQWQKQVCAALSFVTSSSRMATDTFLNETFSSVAIILE